GRWGRASVAWRAFREGAVGGDGCGGVGSADPRGRRDSSVHRGLRRLCSAAPVVATARLFAAEPSADLYPASSTGQTEEMEAAMTATDLDTSTGTVADGAAPAGAPPPAPAPADAVPADAAA